MKRSMLPPKLVSRYHVKIKGQFQITWFEIVLLFSRDFYQIFYFHKTFTKYFISDPLSAHFRILVIVWHDAVFSKR